MIGNRGFGRWRGASNFYDLVQYAKTAHTGHRVLAMWTSNIASVETAAFEMTTTWGQSKVEEPAYHLIGSWATDEWPTFVQMRQASAELFKTLNFGDLQSLTVVQSDGAGGKVHLHSVVNLVDPLTFRGRSVWRDRPAIRQACREIERANGWRVVGFEDANETNVVSYGTPEVIPNTSVAASVVGESGDNSGSHGLQVAEAKFERDRGVFDGRHARSNWLDMYGMQSKFREWMLVAVAPKLVAVLSSNSASWLEVTNVLAQDRLRYEVVADTGARIVGGVSGFGVTVSEIGLRHASLEERLGPWPGALSPNRKDRDADLEQRVALARSTISELADGAGWAGVHATLRDVGIGIERHSNGMRVVELDGPGWVRVAASDVVLSGRALRGRFGNFEPSADQAGRDYLRELVASVQDASAERELVADPTPIFATLLQTQSVVSPEDLQADVARRIGDPAVRERVTAAVLGSMVALEIDGAFALTTRGTIEEEQSAFAAARSLASGWVSRPVFRRFSDQAPADLRGAYEYSVAPDLRLKLVTGLSASASSALIDEVAAGYRSIGYRVRALAVEQSAVERILRQTTVPVMSFAAAAQTWREGDGVGRRDPERLGPRDAVVVDDVGSVGTEYGAVLLREAARGGAVVIALGGDAPSRPVGRGNALRIIRSAVGDRVLDLEVTNSGPFEWKKIAADSLRHGRVREALSMYRDQGRYDESQTQTDAIKNVVGCWTALEAAGVQATIVAYGNVDRWIVNGLARESYRSLGALHGRDTELETTDGDAAYAVGERVIIREPLAGGQLSPGSFGRIVAMRASVVSIQSRDGVVTDVDTVEHPGIQYGYCVDGNADAGAGVAPRTELVLLANGVQNGSVTSRLGRAIDDVRFFYALDQFSKGFGDVVRLGVRTHQKVLTLDGVERGRASEVFARVSIDQAVRERASALDRSEVLERGPAIDGPA